MGNGEWGMDKTRLLPFAGRLPRSGVGRVGGYGGCGGEKEGTRVAVEAVKHERWRMLANAGKCWQMLQQMLHIGEGTR
jgi:hypothetical protein